MTKTYIMQARAQFKRRSTANNVEILVPVPEDADSPRFRTNIGSVHYAPEKSAIIWKIKQFGGGKEFLMRAELGLPSVKGDDEHGGGMTGGFGGSMGGVAGLGGGGKGKRPISVKFEIPYFTTSGIQVRYLKIIEPKVSFVFFFLFFLSVLHFPTSLHLSLPPPPHFPFFPRNPFLNSGFFEERVSRILAFLRSPCSSAMHPLSQPLRVFHPIDWPKKRSPDKPVSDFKKKKRAARTTWRELDSSSHDRRSSTQLQGFGSMHVAPIGVCGARKTCALIAARDLPADRFD